MFREDILQAKIRQPYQVHCVDALCEVDRDRRNPGVYDVKKDFYEKNCKICSKPVGENDRFFVTRLFHSDIYHHECFLKGHPFVSVPDFADFHKLKYQDQLYFRDIILETSADSFNRMFAGLESSSNASGSAANERPTTRKRSHSETDFERIQAMNSRTAELSEKLDPVYYVINKFKIISQLETRPEGVVVAEKIDTLTHNGQELPKNWVYTKRERTRGGRLNIYSCFVSFHLDYAIADCIVYGANRKCPECNQKGQRKGKGILLFAVDRYICCGYRHSMYDCNYETTSLQRKNIKLDPNIYHTSPFHNICEEFAKYNEKRREIDMENQYVMKLLSKLAGNTYYSRRSYERQIVKKTSEIISEAQMSHKNETQIIYKAHLVKDPIEATGKVPFVKLEARKMNNISLYCILQEWGFNDNVEEDERNGRVTYFHTEDEAKFQFEWAFEFETGNDYSELKGKNMEEAFVKMWSMFYPSSLPKSKIASQDDKVNNLVEFMFEDEEINLLKMFRILDLPFPLKHVFTTNRIQEAITSLDILLDQLRGPILTHDIYAEEILKFEAILGYENNELIHAFRKIASRKILTGFRSTFTSIEHWQNIVENNAPYTPLLKVKIEHIEYQHHDFKIIQKYLQNGMQGYLDHECNYSIEIMNAFRVNTDGFSKIHKPLLLWHGTSVKNVSGILNKGFIIDPEGGKHFFGPGVYLCDVPPLAIQAMNRWGKVKQPNEAILLLCEVATKDFQEIEANNFQGYRDVQSYANRFRNPELQKNGVIVKEDWGPNSTETMDEGRLIVPSGKPVRIRVFRGPNKEQNFGYTRYLAFKPELVRVKFLVQAQFKRNSNWIHVRNRWGS